MPLFKNRVVVLGDSHLKNRVLIVEDDRTTGVALRRILQSEGFAATVATTIAIARTALDHPDTLDCVVLDLLLPDGNGIEILRDIRAANLPIRVVVVTGAGAGQAAIAELNGADRVIEKPMSVAELVAAIRGGADIGD